ncbi:DUF1574 family protein [Marinilabilia salmonicolor]|uniref:Uncharacterized protein DUF1574 n=1 Tax=Marinilabilia salmonicolor TaxID=989 RepID=A0A368UIP3_9BACT|nr:DUF1574 family protein [Marinilabilia salmonicolor]RCW19612.1 uncharacterized protein DUF1574 [Marinilabilia salmonicolor]
MAYIKLAINHNIKVLFYTSPAYSTYRQNLDEIQLNETINAITLIANKNENCYYLNLLDDNRFKAKDFRDADHLNGNGAKKLTKIIYKKIKLLKHERTTKLYTPAVASTAY